VGIVYAADEQTALELAIEQFNIRPVESPASHGQAATSLGLASMLEWTNG
jgi:hypothetical protein